MPLLVHHKTPKEYFPARDPFFHTAFWNFAKRPKPETCNSLFCYIRTEDEGDKILNKQMQYRILRYCFT